jgi:hypothetical protein
MRYPLSIVALALLLAGCPELEPEELLDEPPPCGRADLANAPPPRDEPGLGMIAAVDIDRVEVQVKVDADAEELRFTSVAHFAVGEADALPVMQFMPLLDELILDGATLDPTDLSVVVIAEPPRTIALLPEALPPCSEHTLEARYTVVREDVEPASLPRLRFADEQVWWSSAQEDGGPDQMLEMWLPSNLLFDRYDLELRVTLQGTGEPHDLAANGSVEALADGGWSVAFSGKQPHGPFWVLHPTVGVEQLLHDVALPGGRTVTVDLRRFESDEEVDLAASAAVAEFSLLEYDENLGPYLHGDRYLAWLRTDMDASMEYDGATLTVPDALQHEMAHSWWARGLAPVSDHHGWMDEAAATWGTGGNPWVPSHVEVGQAGGRLLVGEDDWSGADLGIAQYFQGAVVFAGIADRVGSYRLLAELRAFYGLHAPGPVSTDDLERALFCAFEDQYVLDIFHNRVRGLDGYAPEPVEGYCEGL